MVANMSSKSEVLSSKPSAPNIIFKRKIIMWGVGFFSLRNMLRRFLVKN